MTITAVWPITSSDDPNAGDGMTLTEPGEVDTLLKRLADPSAGIAEVRHEYREPADEDGEILDHDVCVAVANGFGYLSYIDVDHEFAVLEGQQDSPGLSGEDIEFPAGSGVAPETLAEALREFMRAGTRPASVSWREVAE